MARAAATLDGAGGVMFQPLPHTSRRAAETVVQAAVARGADQIVLADEKARPGTCSGAGCAG